MKKKTAGILLQLDAGCVYSGLRDRTYRVVPHLISQLLL